MPTIAPSLAFTLGLLGCVAGALDFRYRRIPNWLTMMGFCAGFILNTWLWGFRGGSTALGGAGLAIAIYLPLYLLRAVGGGDVKLMAAVGAISGPALWLLLFIIASLLGGVIAILLILSRHRLTRTFLNIGIIFRELMHLRPPHRVSAALDVTTAQGLRLPHGTVIAAAIALYLAAIWLA